MRRVNRMALASVAIGFAGACVTAPVSTGTGTAPVIPAYAAPIVPPSLHATGSVLDRHAAAWQRLQAGDLRGAARDYTECLRSEPAFYPAAAGLGLVALAGRDFKAAVARFRSALSADDRYVPAWRGLVDAELGAGNVDDAMTALERLLALDPSREEDHSRLELLRLKQMQALMDAAGRARAAGQFDEAERVLERALAVSPRSPIVLRELSQVEVKVGQLDTAEVHARQAIEADRSDAAAYGALAAVLEARGRLREAAEALTQAAGLDPAWRDRARAAGARADDAAMPAEMRDLDRQPSVTRSELAALIGTRLPALVARAPRAMTAVVTDVRGHWAATWIVAVTQAGVMDVFPNHTFQPSAPVRRSDLAQAASALITLALTGKPDQLSRWQSARPVFADLGTSNLLYPPAALSVSAGIMTAGDGRFEPARGITGAEAVEAIARLERLAGRQ